MCHGASLSGESSLESAIVWRALAKGPESSRLPAWKRQLLPSGTTEPEQMRGLTCLRIVAASRPDVCNIKHVQSVTYHSGLLRPSAQASTACVLVYVRTAVQVQRKYQRCRAPSQSRPLSTEFATALHQPRCSSRYEAGVAQIQQ